MSAASPEDLAVTFRSVARRLREAQAGAPADLTAGPVAELHARVADAARLMGTTDDTEAIADAIHARHVDLWDEATLDRLREIALDLGRLLRHVASLTDSGD